MKKVIYVLELDLYYSITKKKLIIQKIKRFMFSLTE